ncbi:MAG: hypothetical protein WBP33_17550 [Saprospiraceae bacterium]|nr:hypothetical protein [Saprospiraceae bacterium]HRG34417.1 hypothetical protein [Saprospiraceae bacterium]
MLSLNRIISFILVYFLCYFSISLIYQRSNFGIKIQRGIINYINSGFSGRFKDTRLYAQALNRKPLDCQIGKAKFQLIGADPVKGFDIRLNFVNSKRLFQRVEESILTGKPNAQVDMHNFNFSSWSSIVLPFTVLFSLWLASLTLVSFRWKSFLLSFIALTGFVILLFYFSLGYMRLSAPLLEPFDVPQWFKYILNQLFFLQSIEFSYISTLVLFVLFTFKSFKPIHIKVSGLN